MSIVNNESVFNPKLSLYIPVIDEKIDQAFITDIFKNLKIGEISRIDFVYSLVGKKQAFIHFNKWFEHGNGLIARERLLNGKDIKVIYDEPWYWKITAARNQPI